MNELEQTKYKLIDKSIVALKEAIRSIDLFDMLGATDMYNTVLGAFESLQVKPEGYKEDDFIEEHLEVLEKGHKKIIGIFEGGSLENLSSIVKEEILDRYTDMKDYYEEKEFCSKNNIDMDGIYYKRFKEANLLEDMDQDVIDEIQNYWEEHSKKKIDPTTNLAFYNLTGKVEPRVVSQIEFNRDIWQMLNDPKYYDFYEDKNVYDTLINPEYSVESVLKRVDGQYFDGKNNTISRGDAFKIFFNIKEDLIVKGSTSNDGKSVEKINYRSGGFYFKNKKIDLRFIEDKWGNDIIIQKVIKQHPMMAKAHKYSVNTFRMVTLRWNNEINYLMTYARFGSNKEVKDNGGEGGIVISVSPEGKINDWGMDDDGNIYKVHPTTGFEFKDFEIVPNFDEYIEYVKKLHNRILHHDYVSWDIAMGLNGEPIFIEMNFRGPIWKYQIVTERPIFGEFTEDILAKAVERREKIEEQQRIAQEKRQAKIESIEKAKKEKQEREKNEVNSL